MIRFKQRMTRSDGSEKAATMHSPSQLKALSALAAQNRQDLQAAASARLHRDLLEGIAEKTLLMKPEDCLAIKPRKG
jgi:hypothetical protein